MLQLFFMTVITCLLCGVLLAEDLLRKMIPSIEILGNTFKNEWLKAFLFSVSLLTGLANLFVMKIVEPPFVGNIVPAFIGIIAGVRYLTGFIQDHFSVENAFVSFIGKFKRFDIVLGCLSISAGVIHFFIPTAVFF